MTEAWLEILREHGWVVPLHDAVWCTTGPDERSDWCVNVCRESVRRAPRRDGFKVLGVQVTFDNSFESELQIRISRSWRAFYKYKHLLCHRDSPLKDRLSLLCSLVSNSLFWCAGSWNLTKRQASKLRGLQLSMLQKMITLKRFPAESDESFMSRLNSKIKHLRIFHKLDAWDKQYYKIMFQWAGHVSRMASYHEHRLTHRVLQHKSWKWIQRVAGENFGNQLHCRKLKVWRWEAPLYKFFGNESWHDAALDKASWHSKLEEMVSWRC